MGTTKKLCRQNMFDLKSSFLLFLFLVCMLMNISNAKSCDDNSDCHHDECCSQFGTCGSGPEFCGFSCTVDEQCGGLIPHIGSQCCSDNGNCGLGPEFCSNDNQDCNSHQGYCKEHRFVCFILYCIFCGDDYGLTDGPCDDYKLQSSDGPCDDYEMTSEWDICCNSDDDCGKHECCSEFGYCGSGPEYCGKECNIDSDCEHHDECCSKYGNCGEGPEFCVDHAICQIDYDCPGEQCCSEYGDCGYGPEYCNHKTTEEKISTTTNPTTSTQTSSTTEDPVTTISTTQDDTTTEIPEFCHTDIDCQSNECCSLSGRCGEEYCVQSTIVISTTEKIPGSCQSANDCPGSLPWCCDDNHCVFSPTDCNDGECATDDDCEDASFPCCSKFGYCGNGPEFCN